MTIHQSEEVANVTQMNATNIPIILFEYSTECYNKNILFYRVTLLTPYFRQISVLVSGVRQMF